MAASLPLRAIPAVEIEPLPPLPLDSRPLITVGEKPSELEEQAVDDRVLDAASRSLRQLQATRDRIGQLLRQRQIAGIDDETSDRFIG